MSISIMKCLKPFYDFWIRNTRKFEISDCIPCSTRQALECVPLFIPIKGFCKHGGKRFFSETQVFKARKCYTWISIIMIITVVLGEIWNNLYLIAHSCPESKVQCLLIVSEQLFSLCGIILIISIWRCKKAWVVMLNRWCDIVEKREEFGMPNLLPATFCRKYTLQTIVVKIILYLVVLMLSVAALCSPFLIKSNFIENLLVNKLIAVFSAAVQLVASFVHSCEITFIRRIMKSAQKQLIFNMSLPDDENVTNLESFLRKYVRLHLAMTSIFKFSSTIISPRVLFWLAFSVANLIINIYLYIIQWEDNYAWQIVILQIRIFILVIILIYLITISDTENTSEDILSFLFKYPISKLSTAEAIQVEMLISALTIEKPVLKASGTFVIGTRLLAAISGTVLTYVLVALQFRASWAKN